MTHTLINHKAISQEKMSVLKSLGRLILTPASIILCQPLLDRILSHVIRNNQGIFQRLGNSTNKTLVINPTNLPFALVLKPNPASPSLRVVRNLRNVEHDAIISGSLLNLMRLVDGQLDGDSLFFTRDLTIQGDTESIVALRNALDNMEHSLVEDIANQLGTVGKIALHNFRNLKP